MEPLDFGDTYSGDDTPEEAPQPKKVKARPEITMLLAEAEKAVIAAQDSKCPPEVHAPKKTVKEGPVSPCAVGITAGLAVAVLQKAAGMIGFPLPSYYKFLPSELLSLLPVDVWLALKPVAWPALAAISGTTLGWVFKKENPKQITCRLSGFVWDRNSFCRGWLITGATGSGKTQSAINALDHQVFQNECGEEKESWKGSELERKTLTLIEQYKSETAPFLERIGRLEKEIAKLQEEREKLVQATLSDEIDGSIYSSKAAQKIRLHQNELANLNAEKQRIEDSADSADQERLTEVGKEIQLLTKVIEELQQKPWIAAPDSKAAQELIGCDDQLAVLHQEIEIIETEEILARRTALNSVLKKVERARYKVFPWGGLCIDEKGLFWQTKLKISRTYNREHHLMLLQTRPDWASPGWTPPARFNLLSDEAIPANTYAKALVDTATQVAGGAGDKGFFKTQAESNIGWAIELDRAIRAAEIALGVPPEEATQPSIKNCLNLLSASKNYAAYLAQKGCTETKGPGDVVHPPRLQSEKLRIAMEHFQNRYWSQPKDQLGGVIGTIYNYLNYFAGDEVAEVFCADNTFEFKDIDRGMILMVAMPQKLAVERRYVCTLLKLLFYSHVLRRFGLTADDPAWINRNLLICWQDEAQRFVTQDDGNVDVIREAGATTVMACQSKVSLYPPLGGKEKANVTILNLRNRLIFTAADDECATASADFLGKTEKKKKSISKGKGGTSVSISKEDVHKIKPHQFRMLPKFYAIVCHADGQFKRALLPPIDFNGKLPKWFREPFSWKVKKLLGIRPF